MFWSIFRSETAELHASYALHASTLDIHRGAYTPRFNKKKNWNKKIRVNLIRRELLQKGVVGCWIIPRQVMPNHQRKLTSEKKRPRPPSFRKKAVWKAYSSFANLNSIPTIITRKKKKKKCLHNNYSNFK